jgi:hypothetical protein
VALAVPALAAQPAAAAETVWLCKPGVLPNPCLSDETATVELGNGTSFVEHARPDNNAPIDCFYVYPTVSGQSTRNANLAIEPEETQIAIDQASRFSQTCKVYAPVYPQLTLAALNRGEFTLEGEAEAYIGVATAFAEYMARYNHGRGFVLIGHSQGAGMLIRLLAEQIDPNPALRKQLVSAILLGGNAVVPTGGTVGGSFQNVPECTVAWQVGCVIAYSSFEQQPPVGALFGRSGVPGFEVMCVNPVLPQLGERNGPLLSYTSTTPFPGPLGFFVQTPKAPTPWVATPAQYSGGCRHAEGASWLQLTPSGPPGDTREPLFEVLGPTWGTHLADVNIALGNLVGLVRIETGAYLFGSQP